MKKSTFISTIAFAFVMLLTTNVNAQKFSSLDKSPMDAAFYKNSRNAAPLAKVVYSRPQLKGRALSSLAPNGKVWRTGANETSEITFYNDATFGGKSVKAGTYSLLTIPGDGEWTIILNSDVNTWGAYNYNKSNDVARVSAKSTQAGDSIDAFSIVFSDGNMHLGWGTTRVAVAVK